MIKILKKQMKSDTQSVVADKQEVAYQNNNILIFQDGSELTLSNDAFITPEFGDGGRLYAFLDSSIYRVNKGGIELACNEKAPSFNVVSKYQIISSCGELHSDNYTYYQHMEEKWSFPRARGILASSSKTLFTTSAFKVAKIDFRNIETFKIMENIFPKEGFEFLLTSNYRFSDRVIFIQSQKKRDTSKMQQVIATCCDLDSGKILWETHFQGSHRYILNDADGNLYALFGRHEPGGKTLYLNCLNTSTGQVTLDIVEKNTVVASVPWLAQIYKNVMYVSDFYTAGCVIWAFDLASKKITSHFNLGLEKGVELNAPVIRNDELYALDSTKTLHVFDIIN